MTPRRVLSEVLTFGIELATRSKLEPARAQTVQEDAPSKLTGPRVAPDSGALKRKTGPARHAHGDAFFHLDRVTHQLGSALSERLAPPSRILNPPAERLWLELGLV